EPPLVIRQAPPFDQREHLITQAGAGQQAGHPDAATHSRMGHQMLLKFLRLWAVALDLGADLILVNYASKGTEYEDHVLVMRVLKIDENDYEEPIKTQNYPMTRAEFKKRFRDLNR